MKKLSIITIQFSILLAVFALTVPLRASASILYTGSASQTVYAGQSFVIEWFLNTQGQSINAIKINLDFSSSTLEVTDLSTSNSVFSLWTSTPMLESPGKIFLEGGIPAGLSGNSLPVFRSTFKATKTGQATITMGTSSQVLLNDGKGTADAVSFSAMTFPILPSGLEPIKISSITHPDQNSWYKNKNVEIEFIPKAGENYSYSFSSNLDITPPDKPMEMAPKFTYKDLPDGIYYFKLNSKIGNGNWQEAGIYRINIDTTPPQDFTPIISSGENTFNSKPFISFVTVDKTSGIKNYKIKIGLFGHFKTASSPYILHKALIGDTITIQAIDTAGNARSVTLNYPGYISNKLFALLVLLLLFIASLLLYKKFKKQN